MKYLGEFLVIYILTFFICSTDISANVEKPNKDSNQLINRIEGQVWDPYGNGVADIYVELQNELYSTLSRIRTDASGRFSFTGVSSGHFNIRILTTGTNYLEYTEGIDVINVFQGSSDAVYLDIHLKIDKRRSSNTINTGTTDAIFVQEIPQEALKLYKKGTKSLENKSERGLLKWSRL